MHFENPVIRGFHPDPSVCRVGADFYLVTSSFEYFPALPIFQSTDLVNWTQIGHCITRPDQLDLSRVPDSGGLWAPTIRFHKGTFFVACTILDRANFTNEIDEITAQHDYTMAGRHFIVSASDPLGPWSDPVWVDGEGFDPSLLFDGDNVYFTHAAGGAILQSELNLETGSRIGDVREIWRGTGEMSTEGPHLYEIDGYYYLIVAEGGTSYGHSIACARSSSPWGPWEEHPGNPVLTHRTQPDDPVQGTGHGDLVCDAEGNWWIVFLAIRAQGYPPFHTTGRETFLARVRWESGWPWVEGPVTAGSPAETSRGLAVWRADFSGRSLGFEWNFLRSRDDRVAVQRNRLVLDSTPSYVEPAGRQAFVGIRQSESRCVVTAKFVILRDHVGEFGLTVRMNDRHRYDLSVIRHGAELIVRSRFHIGGLVKTSTAVAVAVDVDGELRLGIRATPFAYFFFATTESEMIDLGISEARYLSSEVAGGFTGVYFGLFAGEGAIATVSSFEIESQ